VSATILSSSPNPIFSVVYILGAPR
jgi:hypothetical protein